MKLETATRNAAANAIADKVDAAGGAGYIILQDSDENRIAKIDLNPTAFGDASAGVITAADIDSYTIDTTSNDNAGTVATGTDPYGALLYNAGSTDDSTEDGSIPDGTDDELVASLTVTSTGGGGDVELSGLTYQNGDTVSISSFTITVPQGV